MMRYRYRAEDPCLSEEEQLHIAGGKDVLEKVHLARRQDLSKNVVKMLASDLDERVRMELAVYTNQEDIWKMLYKKDHSPKVHKYAKINHSFGKKKGFI